MIESNFGMRFSLRSFDVVGRLVVTEKSTNMQSLPLPKYVFVVSPSVRKDDFRVALEKVFNVRVLRVNSVIVKGKNVSFKGRKGKTSTVKKMIATLSAGSSIDLNEG